MSAVCTGWIQLNDKCSRWAKTSASAPGGGGNRHPGSPLPCALLCTVCDISLCTVLLPTGLALLYRAVRIVSICVRRPTTVTATTSPWELCIPCLTWTTFPLRITASILFWVLIKLPLKDSYQWIYLSFTLRKGFSECLLLFFIIYHCQLACYDLLRLNGDTCHISLSFSQVLQWVQWGSSYKLVQLLSSLPRAAFYVPLILI